MIFQNIYEFKITSTEPEVPVLDEQPIEEVESDNEEVAQLVFASSSFEDAETESPVDSGFVSADQDISIGAIANVPAGSEMSISSDSADLLSSSSLQVRVATTPTKIIKKPCAAHSLTSSTPKPLQSTYKCQISSRIAKVLTSENDRTVINRFDRLRSSAKENPKNNFIVNEYNDCQAAVQQKVLSKAANLQKKIGDFDIDFFSEHTREATRGEVAKTETGQLLSQYDICTELLRYWRIAF